MFVGIIETKKNIQSSILLLNEEGFDFIGFMIIGNYGLILLIYLLCYFKVLMKIYLVIMMIIFLTCVVW